MSKPDFSKLAHMLIDNDKYWEEKDLTPPNPKEKHKLHKALKEIQ